MTLDIVKSAFCGTDIIINGERKHTYGYKFTNIYNKKGEFTLWFCFLTTLIKRWPKAMSSNEVYQYFHYCNPNCKGLKSNHDLLSALKNCGLINNFRHGKFTFWYVTNKGKEYINEIHESNGN